MHTQLYIDVYALFCMYVRAPMHVHLSVYVRHARTWRRTRRRKADGDRSLSGGGHRRLLLLCLLLFSITLIFQLSWVVFCALCFCRVVGDIGMRISDTFSPVFHGFSSSDVCSLELLLLLSADSRGKCLVSPSLQPRRPHSKSRTAQGQRTQTRPTSSARRVASFQRKPAGVPRRPSRWRARLGRSSSLSRRRRQAKRRRRRRKKTSARETAHAPTRSPV